MGGLIEFFISINKIALFAFFAVLAFLVFEVKKLTDEKKKKEQPVVPQFNDSINSTPLPAEVLVKSKSSEKPPILMLIIGSLSLIGVMVIALVTYNVQMKKNKISSTPIPIIREIQSSGLVIFNAQWREIDSKKNELALPGEKLYVAIKTIDEVDIDRARIKINADEWQIADITTLFNPQLRVYYREYIVATGTAQLKIEAQLHSASDGWMGD